MVRGTITKLDSYTKALMSKVCKYRYEQDMSIVEVVETLRSSGCNISTAKVAYMLKVDSDRRVQEFREIPSDSPERVEALIILVQFLRDKRKYTYNKITEELGISKEALANVLGSRAKATGELKKPKPTNEGKIEDYIRLNAEGKSLSEIAMIYNVSRQAVSKLFKKMGYIPKTGTALTKMKIEKHAPELLKNISKDYLDAIKTLKEEERSISQTLAVHKHWATQSLTKLRIELIKIYVEGSDVKHSKETDKAFLTSYTTLLKYMNQYKGKDPMKLPELAKEILYTLEKAKETYNFVRIKYSV